ncbi:hypothetical protein F2Q68_00034001 [Brassica cretica]|uniref:Uncharacterized protein n=2 Tax=Brassica cretica TaxID=69181 RepID=A0ABQ7EIL1_BRACR|nr:hypothetical protein F2Q68_00034001 [Brassica cretica]KAF3596882.1 hypothetical protein DY000_02021402 [Brassica cretica]
MTSPMKAETKSREVKNANERRSQQHLRGAIDNSNRHCIVPSLHAPPPLTPTHASVAS